MFTYREREWDRKWMHTAYIRLHLSLFYYSTIEQQPEQLHDSQLLLFFHYICKCILILQFRL